jgi:glycosyltransferase involved in cell wall biosynthesis
MNDILSICIPTYKGELKLKQSLGVMLPYLKELGIPIYICDNASPDNTKNYITELQLQYEKVYYTRNDENIGADKNFEKVLKISESKFCWLLGDDDIIKKDALIEVLKNLNNDNDYDFICVNAHKRIDDKIKTQVMVGGKEVINKLGAHLTFMSTLIFKKSLLDGIDFSKYYNTWFLQTGMVYDIIANENSKTLWVNIDTLSSVEVSNCSWINEHFYTFTTRLYLFSMLLPEYYNIDDRNAFVRSHAGMLSNNLATYLILARRRGEISIKKLYNYRKHILTAIGGKYFVFSIFLSLIPKFAIKGSIRIKKLIKK